MKKILCLALITVFLLTGMAVVAGCGGGDTEPAKPSTPETKPDTPATPDEPSETPVDPNEVEITSKGFNPEVLTIKVGEKVTWFNKDTRRWWVSSKIKVPDTGVIPTGIRMTYTFKEAGEYDYYDLYHKEIIGKIIVVE